jgi:hypothetical protein
MFMKFNALQREKREPFCQAWAALGLYLFLSAFFWASGPAPLRTVFYVFLLLPFLAVLPWRKFQLEQYGNYFTVSALLYAGYTVLASLWGEPEDFGFYLKQWFFLAFWLTGVAWLFYYREVNLQRLYRVIVGIAVVCALVTLYFFYIHKNYNIAARLSGFGLAENSTIVAQIFGLAALLGYILSLQTQNWKMSPLFLLAALVCTLPLVMSQSRGAGLALIVACLLALLTIRPRPAIWVPQVMLVVIALGIFFGLTDMGDILERRGLSFSFRDAIWKELIVYRVPHHLFFGIGMEAEARLIIPDVDVFHHAHNSWIDILYYAGSIGLGLALWHLFLLLRSFSREKDVLPLYLWLVYGCICLFSNGSTLLTRPDAQWLMYWVPAGLLAARIMSQRHVR